MGFHIIYATIGVGLPLMMLINGDRHRPNFVEFSSAINAYCKSDACAAPLFFNIKKFIIFFIGNV
ncbi:hypothetical protein ABE29_07055 [Cytobacillus firmus]|nr:hypothetical protein [Cytobacillus firmus]MBG9552223.1 hypothetical protein [Cytobacillus firmus]MBG9559189.1 hypothetical protein [Cytobacillus firmus]MBG9576243.1 hypothetical protein [Cytobacillus firmus]MBG9655137.1 hypothetical protein [Cytobacillus firmus]